MKLILIGGQDRKYSLNSNAGGDRISYAKGNGQEFELYFGGYLSNNSGYIIFGSADELRPPMLFCLQPDDTFLVHSPVDDGTTPDDPTFMVTCPPESKQFVFVDNGLYMSTNPDKPCYPDTMIFDRAIGI